MLDEAGIDFMLPIARWIGYGGETDFHGGVLETMTWAAGLLAATKNIAVFRHHPHRQPTTPAVAAKQIATIDQIGHGRAGLNIVAGWNKPEYEALGLTLPDDHETRYAYAQEWFDLVRKLWASDEHFRLGRHLLQGRQAEQGRSRPAAGFRADHQRRRLTTRPRLCHRQRRFPVHPGD
jgi:dimethylsulfone monooxygenase